MRPEPRIGVLGLGGLGGSGRVAHDVAAALAKLGHPTFSLTCEGCQFGSEGAGWTTHVPVRAPRTPRPADDTWVEILAADLEQAVVEHRLTVLSVHYGVGLAEAAVRVRNRLHAQGVALRVCVTLHGTDVTELARDPAQAARLRAALDTVDDVSVVSEWLAQRALEQRLLARRPRVIPNGIDLDVFRPASDAREVEPPLLVHASNFRPIKRPLDTVQLLRTLHDRGVDARLELIGDGPLRGAAEAKAEALGVRDDVSFVRPLSQQDLAARLRTATVALVTSEAESFGLFAVESMASGLVLAGWRCEGLLGTLSEEPSLADAALVPLGEFDELAGRVRQILHDDVARRALVQRGVALCRASFSRSRQVEGYRRSLGIQPRERHAWPRDARI